MGSSLHGNGGEKSAAPVCYVLGIDGGGTKSALAAVRENGEELFRCSGGGLNPTGRDPADAARSLSALLHAAAAQVQGACAGICIGAAGWSKPDAAAALQSIAKSVHPGCPVWVTGDHEAALAGAFTGGPGLLLIAGTGSICCGLSADGVRARAGGLGHIMDDRGSGYDIGRRILQSVACAADGREAPTALTKLVLERLGLGDMRQLVGWVYDAGHGKEAVASLAALLPDARDMGDRAAAAVTACAADDLAALVPPVARRLALEAGRLVMTGGVLLHDQALRAQVWTRLSEVLPALRQATPCRDAAFGAALLAWRHVRGVA